MNYDSNDKWIDCRTIDWRRMNCRDFDDWRSYWRVGVIDCYCWSLSYYCCFGHRCANCCCCPSTNYHHRSTVNIHHSSLLLALACHSAAHYSAAHYYNYYSAPFLDYYSAWQCRHCSDVLRRGRDRTPPILNFDCRWIFVVASICAIGIGHFDDCCCCSHCRHRLLLLFGARSLPKRRTTSTPRRCYFAIGPWRLVN